MIFGFDPNEAERMLKEKVPYSKVIIEVTALWKKTGEIVPLSLIWNDREYRIEKILESRKGKSLKVQATGYRYRCQVGEKIFNLYYDNTNWFIEKAKF
ncbi:MAG: hypothetical protein GX824_01785 [Clostridiales bacterium]|nr:hypothetical protein [Clostridiales bacterium]